MWFLLSLLFSLCAFFDGREYTIFVIAMVVIVRFMLTPSIYKEERNMISLEIEKSNLTLILIHNPNTYHIRSSLININSPLQNY